jgi:hypothetical protein
MIAWLLTLIGCGKPRNPMADLPALGRDADMKLFYPVLRNYDASDVFAQTVVHRPIATGLAVFACRRVPRPEGRTGIDYVMKKNLSVYGMSEEQILSACYSNFFADHIKVDVREQDKSKLFQFTSSGKLVAAILGHEPTYKQFVQMTSSSNMAVLIMSPEMICATTAGSSFEPGLHNIAQEMRSQSGVIDLTPAVYYWTSTGKLVTESEWQRQNGQAEPSGPVNGSQPVRPGTNGSSGAAGSRR